MLTKQLEQIENAIEEALTETGMKGTILSIPGIGIVTAASFFGEIGDPLRFDHPRQISKMAGYNLIEDSSGKNISGTSISKRGRKNLRNVLYQMARTMVAVNAEMKELYQYLKTRPNNPSTCSNLKEDSDRHLQPDEKANGIQSRISFG